MQKIYLKNNLVTGPGERVAIPTAVRAHWLSVPTDMK